MAARQILSCGTLLALAVLAGLLPTPAKGNVAAGQRALQREQLGESGGPPEVVSINDNGADYRELEEPWSDYSIKSRINDVAGVDALINYLLQARRMRSAGSYNDNQLQLNRAQKKKSYWKQCAFNAVSCFG